VAIFKTKTEAKSFFKGAFEINPDADLEQCDRCKKWSVSQADDGDGEIGGAGEVEEYDRLCDPCLDSYDEWPENKKKDSNINKEM